MIWVWRWCRGIETWKGSKVVHEQSHFKPAGSATNIYHPAMREHGSGKPQYFEQLIKSPSFEWKWWQGNSCHWCWWSQLAMCQEAEKDKWMHWIWWCISHSHSFVCQEDKGWIIFWGKKEGGAMLCVQWAEPASQKWWCYAWEIWGPQA